MIHIPGMQTHPSPQAEEAALRAVFAVAHVRAQRSEAQARMTAAIIFNILRLLARAGFSREVGLVVTSAGKHQGWIWPKLGERVTIEELFLPVK